VGRRRDPKQLVQVLEKEVVEDKKNVEIENETLNYTKGSVPLHFFPLITRDKKRARFSSVPHPTTKQTNEKEKTQIKHHHVRRRSLHRRFQILRPAYRRPAIRPIFQRHHRSQREWKIQHFGFHLLRVRDYQFESGTRLTRVSLSHTSRENSNLLVL